MDKQYFENKKDFNGTRLIDEIKGYAHFDRKISMNSCWDYISDPEKIAHHKFYPFIKFDQVFIKYVLGDQSKDNAWMSKKEKNKRKVKKTKKREICYASHVDSCIYTYYAAELSQKYNEILAKEKIDYMSKGQMCSSVIAYRTNLDGKSNVEFAHEAIEFIRELEKCMVIVGDFKSFFDTLDHSYLKMQLKNILGVKNLTDDLYAVFKNITKYSYVDLGQLMFRTCKKDYCYKHKYLDIKNKKLRKKGRAESAFCCRHRTCQASAVGETYGDIQRFASVTQKEADDNYLKGRCLNRFCLKAFNESDKIDIGLAKACKLIKNPYRKNEEGIHQPMGIPQGSAISAVLANVYMYEFDKSMVNYVRQLKGKYMRYSDDFIVILPQPVDLGEFIKYLKELVLKTNITLEDKKTQVFNVDLKSDSPILSCSSEFLKNGIDGKHAIDYLGFTFDGVDVSIKAKTIFKYYYRMYSKIKYIKRYWVKHGKYSIGTANLYNKYSAKNLHWKDKSSGKEDKKNKRNFINYVYRAKRVFTNDEKIDLPARRHMDKIRSRLNCKTNNKDE